MTKRLLIACAVLVGIVSPAFAQFSLIGQVNTNCTTTVASCTFSAGVSASAGDLIVVMLSERDNQEASSISDGVNSGYTCPAGANITNTGSTFRSQICYYINSGAGTVTPAITNSVNGRTYMTFAVFRPTGTVTIDQTGENQSGSTSGAPHTGPTFTVGANAKLIITMGALSGVPTSCTPGAAWTNFGMDPTGQRLCAEYDITSVSGSYTGDFTTGGSVQDAIVMASFNDVAASTTLCCGFGLPRILLPGESWRED